ncbi:stage II sporulation E family protein, partial [Vibrio parahaemolyticus V-223/04]
FLMAWLKRGTTMSFSL